MKLTNAYINGFGKWVDYSIDFTSDLSTIYGENESGKSTIQRFIMFMLFGFTPKQREFYRPKESGRMGGRLTIYDTEVGYYTIERHDAVQNGAAICLVAGGNEYDEKWLRERLRGMNLGTYQSIFSFSALDLSAIKEMKEEKLSDILLSIGLTGSTTIHSLEKQLDNRMAELFKPAGKRPAINKQLELLEERFTSLQSFQANEGTYREKKAAILHLNEQLNHLQSSVQKEKSDLNRIEKQQQALPVIADYQHYSALLSDYPKEITFPEEGMERFEKVKEALLPLQSQISVLVANEENYRHKIEKLQRERSESTYKEALEIIQKRQSILDVEKDIEQIRSAIDRKEVQIEAELIRLNIGLDRKELAHLSLPFHLEKTWTELKNNGNKLDLDKEQLQLEESQLKQERNFLISQIQVLEDGLLSEEELQEVNHKMNDHKEHDLLQKLKGEANRKWSEWQKSKETKTRNINHLLFVFIALALLAGIIAMFSDQTWLFQVMIISILIGGLQWFFRRKTMKTMERMMTQSIQPERKSKLPEEERLEAEQALAIQNKHMRELETLEEKAKENEIARLKFADTLQAHNKKKDRYEARIETEYNNYPFLGQVHISYWPDLYHSMKHLLMKVQERQQELDKREQLEQSRRILQTVIQQFYERNSWKLKSTDTLINQLEVIEAYCTKELQALIEIEKYSDLHDDNQRQQQEIKQKMKVYEREITSLYDFAHVEIEEAYYQKAKQKNEKQDLELSVEKTISQLKIIFSKNGWQQYAEDNTDRHTLDLRHEQTMEQIEQLEQQIESTRKLLAETNASIASMESSESYSDSLHHFEMEREQLKKLAKEWSVLKMAKEMLVETKQDYRDKYLSKVMELTSDYFKELTGGSYIHVYAPNENKPFRVEMVNGIRFTINELSQGTIDQLYIALRLAISVILSEKHRMPFIIDDAFVHFDSMRTKRMLKIMESIAEQQQVIIFTCKQEVAATTPERKVIDLAQVIS